MWSDNYIPLSRLPLRDEKIGHLAWRDGKLYFSLRAVDDAQPCDERAVVVATVDNAPHEGAEILESASVDKLYIMSGERTFCSHTRGRCWEEL